MNTFRIDPLHVPPDLVRPICDSIRELMLHKAEFHTGEIYTAVHKAIPMSLSEEAANVAAEHATSRLIAGINAALRMDLENDYGTFEYGFTMDGGMRSVLTMSFLQAALTMPVDAMVSAGVAMSGISPMRLFELSQAIATKSSTAMAEAGLLH